jgi:hypothetical protein
MDEVVRRSLGRAERRFPRGPQDNLSRRWKTYSFAALFLHPHYATTQRALAAGHSLAEQNCKQFPHRRILLADAIILLN